MPDPRVTEEQKSIWRKEGSGERKIKRGIEKLDGAPFSKGADRPKTASKGVLDLESGVSCQD